MSVLKKIGVFLAGAGSDITKLLGLPFISQILGALPAKISGEVKSVVGVVQTGVADLNTFFGIISLAEAMYPAGSTNLKTGSQKLAAAAPIVQKAILAYAESNLPGHNKVIVAPDVFAAHCQALTSDLANILNDFGE
jgi:hypothetical protein